LQGGAGPDNLTGNNDNDNIVGGGGNDTIDGGAGNDRLDGSSGNDTIATGPGTDIVSGGDGNDSLTANGGDAVINGDAGNDTIVGGAGYNTLDGDDGNDVIFSLLGGAQIIGGAGDDKITVANLDYQISGSDGNDTVSAGNGNNLVFGDAGNDLITVGDGNNTILGGLGNDSMVAGNGGNSIYGDDGIDTITTGSGNDIVFGGTGNDIISTNDGNDAIDSGDGNDSVTAGTGNDTATGGLGSDTVVGGVGQDVIYAGTNPNGNGSTSDVNLIFGDVSISDNTATPALDADLIYGDVGVDTIHAGDGNDSIYGLAGSDSITGGYGADLIFAGSSSTGGGGVTDANTIFGDVTATEVTVNPALDVDTIFGDIGADTIFAGDGGDSLTSLGGNDVIQGNEGGDIVDSGAGNDSVDAGIGNDSITAGTGSDTVIGGYGQDLILAGASTAGGGSAVDANLIFGDVTAAEITITPAFDADVIYGDVGPDTIFGGDGNETIVGFDGNDLIQGNHGDDTVGGDAGNDNIQGNDGIDTIDGGDGNDTVSGGTQNDILNGGLGNDVITGDAGDDLIDSGVGNDNSDGGDGFDVLVQTADVNANLTDNTLTGLGTDTHAAIELVKLTGGVSGNQFDVSNFRGTAIIDGKGGVDTIAATTDSDFLLADWTLRRGSGGAISLNSIENANLTGGVLDNRFDITAWTGGGSLTGGGGIDTVVSSIPANATLTDLILSRSAVGSLTISSIVRATLTGSDAANVIDASAFTGQATINGGAGNDTVFGGSGSDLLDGGAGTDIVSGNGGNDQIQGGGGAGDVLDGGSGNDVITGSNDGADSITGGLGEDRIFGMAGNDSISGGAGNDTIDGGTGDDSISGDAGADLIVGGANHDVLFGHSVSGAGDDNAVDYLYGDFGTNGSELGVGRDKLFGQGGNDALFGEGEDDFIDGGTGASNIINFGAGDGATPNDFVPPAPTPPPTLLPAPSSNLAAASLPIGIDDRGRWTELAGSAAANGVSGDFGQSLEPNIVADTTSQYVAWADNRTGNFEIYVAKHVAGSWLQLGGSASNGGVSNTIAGASRRPSLTLASDGLPVITWTEIVGTSSDIRGAKFDPAANGGQGGWVDLGNISATGAADNVVLLNTTTGLVAAWLDQSAGSKNVYVKRFNGSTWVPLATGSASVTGVSAAAGGVIDLAASTDGSKVAVSWSQQVGATRQIYLKEFSSGTFVELASSASGSGVSNTLGDKQLPTLAYIGGTLLVAWQNTVGTTQEIYSALFNGSAWVAAGTGATSAGGVSNTHGLATQPKLAAASGKLYLIWTDDRTAAKTGNTTEVYARVWSGTDFIEEIRGDASFRGISQSAIAATTPTLSVDPLGRPFVAWDDISTGSPEVRVRGNFFTAAMTYYVNDASIVGDSFTTAIGSSGNDGKSAAMPMLSVQAVLDAYTLKSGDVILVDGGNYSGSITIGSGDTGFLILGSTNHPSIVSGAVSLTATSGVTIANMSLTTGVTVGSANATTLSADILTGAITIAGSNGTQIVCSIINGSLTISGTTTDTAIVGTRQIGGGISITGPATALTLLGNTIRSNATGIAISAASLGTIVGNDVQATGTALNLAANFSGSLSDNDFSGSSVGVAYSAAAPLNGNRIHDNTTGVISTVAGTTNGLGFVNVGLPNENFRNVTGVQLTGQMQNQHIFNNTTGVSGSGILGGTDPALVNFIDANTTGVSFDGLVQYNRIARGTTGLIANNNQLIAHNVFDRVGTTSVAITGKSHVQVVSNTFYSATGSHVVVTGKSNDIEVRNNILWAEAGFDLNIADDSQAGFFSDYNTLYSSGAGQIARWSNDFNDILDWRVDVNRFDGHSLGRTSVNPTLAEPRFVDRNRGDYRVYDLVAGQRLASATVDSADSRTDLALSPTPPANLLSNSGFESGFAGWTTSPGATTGGGSPTPFEGSKYFIGGTAAVAFAEKTVDLVSAGFTAGQLDSQDLVAIFGGRARSATESKADRSSIIIEFQDGSGSPLGSATATSTNPSDRWDLFGDRVAIPIGTRRIKFRYESVLQTGPNNDGHLDAGFLFLQSELTAPNLGWLGNTGDESLLGQTTHIALRSPDLYADIDRDSPNTIRWETFGNNTNAQVKIDLYQDTPDGPAFLLNISAGALDSGSFLWTPANFGVNYGTYGLRVQVSLVGNPTVFDRSQESFAVPESGDNFYVNDTATTNDQYTAAIGSNRNTGRIPAGPKPGLNNLLRAYSLGAGDTLFVDTGTYRTIDPIVISGTVGIGNDEGFTLTGPVGGKVSFVQAANVVVTGPVLELNGADFMVIQNLTLNNGQYGLYVHDQSTNLLAKNITANANSLDGVRIEGGSNNAALENISATGNKRFGIYVASTIDHLTGSSVTLNLSHGIDLEQPGAVRLENNVVAQNLGNGIYITNTISGNAVIGNTDLSLGKGNIISGNAGHGIQTFSLGGVGTVLIAGNTISGHTGFNQAGISSGSNVTVTSNIVFDNFNGIDGPITSPVSNNRIYHNSNFGINVFNGNLTGNVIYSNSIGINGAGGTIRNNLVYGNSTFAIVVTQSNMQLINNTILQTTGDGIKINDNLNNTQLRNNIVWSTSGFDINVPVTSQTGFVSDYNLLFASGTGKVGNWQGIARTTLANWQTATGQDVNSISQDPLLVDFDGADNILGFGTGSDGSDDNFHLRSKFGSVRNATSAPVINSMTGLPIFPSATFVNDAVQSPAIDRGNPADTFANEPVPNGGLINLGWDGNTALASVSPNQFVLVTRPDGGETGVAGQPFAIKWNSHDLTNTVTIELIKSGSPVLTIVSGAPNNGLFNWIIPGGTTPGNDYLVRITRNDLPGSPDDSNNPFIIAAPTTVYYVNDLVVEAGDWTTAAGNDANDGLTPATPKATIAALLATYDLGPGDVVRVDAGTYNISSNIVVVNNDAGVTIMGYNDAAFPTRNATINRGNTSSGSFVFDLQNADSVTLDHMRITAGFTGINLGSSADSDDVVVSNCEIFGHGLFGIDVQSTNDRFTLTSNSVHDNNPTNSSAAGIRLVAANGSVVNNTFFKNQTGVLSTASGASFTGNISFNSGTGFNISSSAATIVDNNIASGNTTGMNVTGFVTLTNNQIYSNTSIGLLQSTNTVGSNNTIFDNATGVLVNGVTTFQNNRVFRNSSKGINTLGNSIIVGNTIYSNAIGIQGTSLNVIRNNLIYANDTAGVAFSGGSGGLFELNTVYQLNGSALTLANSVSNIIVRNNILAAANAPIENVAADSQVGYVGDYNDRIATGTATLMQWGAKSFTSRADLFLDLGFEAHGQTIDPQFIDVDGSDGVLGFSTAANGPAVIIDNGGAGYAETGTWTTKTGGFNGTFRQTTVTGSTATFTFTGLTPGAFYQVAGTWPGGAGTTNFIIHSSNVDRTIQLSQSAPSAGFADAGAIWQILTIQRADSDSMTVTVSAQFANSIADGIRLQQFVGDKALDDNFAVLTTSLTIDAGNPGSAFNLEPSPNGGRVNIGHTGNSAQAAASPAQLVQVLAPNGLEKLVGGKNAVVTWRHAGLPGTTAPVQDVISLDAPLAYYRFGEASGTKAFDASGHGLDATYVGNPTLGVTGAPVGGSNTAVQLTSNKYVQLPSGFADFTKGFTFAVWAFPTAIAGSDTFVDLGNASPFDSLRLFRFNSTNDVRFDVVRAGTQVTSVTAPNAIALNIWQHFAVTIDASGNVKLFKNGQVIATGSGQLPNVINRTNNFIGRSNSANPFNGILDEAAIFDYAMADDRIAAEFASLDYGTSKLELLQNGVPVQTIATAAPNSGKFNWSVPNLPGNNYQVRVTANLAAAPSDSSDEFFQIATAGKDYYVNDASTIGDVFVTAIGNNANDGRSPDAPMASLLAVLQTYGGSFAAGDVIHVDTGNYAVGTNMVLGTNVSGITIQGPSTGPGAVFDRGSSSSGTQNFTMNGADDVIIDHLTLKGANIALLAASGIGSERLTVSNCDITALFAGIALESTNISARILNNRIHDVTSTSTDNAGIRLNANGGLVDGNIVTNCEKGIGSGFSSSLQFGTITNNMVGACNTGMNVFGIAGGSGVVLNNNTVTGSRSVAFNLLGNVTANQNKIFNTRSGNFGAMALIAGSGTVFNNGEIADSDQAVNLAGGTLQNSRVYNTTGNGVGNSGIGIFVQSGSLIGNSIYSNNFGIKGSSSATIRNNSIYANVSGGVYLQGGTNGSFDGNTVYQLTGDALKVDTSAQTLTIRNNIFSVRGGFAVNVDNNSQLGLFADYNFYDIGGTGVLGKWGPASFSSRDEWFYKLGLDQHGQTGDPQFVDPDGADGVLGFATTPLGSPMYIDDGDIGYSEIGTWTNKTTAGFQGDFRTVNVGNKDKSAVFTFSGLTPGNYYNVAATWPAGGSGFSTAEFTVQTGNTKSSPINFSQVTASSGFNENGVNWQTLGQYRADATTLTVTVTGFFTNIIADAARLQQVIGDNGLDDDFTVQITSPTIDAGDPTSSFALEPTPNGTRVNMGSTGNSAKAALSPDQIVQVLSPGGLEKLTTGLATEITWRNSGLPGTIAPIQNVINLDSPSAYYRLGETSGTSAADASGHGLTGTYVGSPTLGVGGSPVGGTDTAVQLASGKYVQLPSGFADFTRGLAIELWAFPTSVTSNARFIELGNGVNADNIFLGRRGTTNDLQFTVLSGNTTIATLTATNALQLNVWQHLAVTMDAQGNIKLFKNGQVIAAGTGQLPRNLTRTVNFMGRSAFNAFGVADYAGVLDEVAIFDQPLTADRINAHVASLDYGTVKIELLQGGLSVQTLSSATPNIGRYTWTPPNNLGNNFEIRITSNLAGSPFGDSQSTFQIVPPGQDYYVNDNSTIGDIYATTIGNDANSGKTSDQPMASLAAVLQAYDLGPGDVIHVDVGTYTLFRNLVIASDDSGITIDGPTVGVATLDRKYQNDSIFSYAIELTGADDVTLNRLNITGASGGIRATFSGHSDRLTISNCDIGGNGRMGIDIQWGNDDAHIINNLVHNNQNGQSTATNIQIQAARGVVSGNEVFSSLLGIDATSVAGGGFPASDRIVISGNIVRDNVNTGISARALVLVEGNTVFGHTGANSNGIFVFDSPPVINNVAHHNNVGISGDGLIDGNRAYANTTGIIARSAAIARNNKSYSNQTGLVSQSATGAVFSNVVYSNTNQGIRVESSSNGVRIGQNTIVQPIGDGIRILSPSQNVKVRDNIINVQVGTALNVDSSSTVGLVNVNNFNGDPLFVDPDGADNVLGYRSSDNFDGGLDDNFYVTKNSPVIDKGDSWNSPATDLLGYTRFDDPGTANTGTNDYFIVSPIVTSVFASAPFPGVAKNFHQDDNAFSQAIPFSFPFYDGTFTSVFVSTNGFLQFTNFPSSGNGNNNLTDFLANRRIAPLYDDLSTVAAINDIFVDTSIANRIMIRWAATNKADGSPVNFAVTLFNTGAIQFDYGPGNTNLTPTVGISFGNSLTGTAKFVTGYDGAATLTNVPSMAFQIAPGVTELGAYEFRGSSLDSIPPTVTSVMPSVVVGGVANQIRITYSEQPNPIDATALAEYELRDAGNDGKFGTADDTIYKLTPQFTPGTDFVLLDVAGGIDLTRVYQLRVSGNTNTAIHDLAGLRLDGDNDGNEGPDFVQTGLLGLPGVTVTPVLLMLAEGGTSEGVSIVLKAQPTANVVITPSPDAFVTAGVASITFTTETWNVPQIIQVTAVDDAFFAGTHFGVMNFVATSADVRYNGIAISSVTATITDNDTPPVIDVVQINDGAAQHSMVKTIQVKFDREVVVDPGAFEIVQSGGGQSVIVSFSTSLVSNKTVATLSFSGALVENNGSLKDGKYDLTVHGDKVHDLFGVELDGDANGTPGGNRVQSVFRLFGDSDGNGTVNSNDFAVFRTFFGLGPSVFDYDGDGQTNSNDFAEFRKRFGITIP